jgi:hypothetical protein
MGEGIFIHEFGHFFGFDHANRNVTISSGYYSVLLGYGVESPGAGPGIGSWTTTNLPDTLWPGDVYGLHSIYGVGDIRPNLKIATYGPGISSANPGQVPFDGPNISVCQGASLSTRFYVGNAGATGVSSYKVSLRIGQDYIPTYPYFSNHLLGEWTQPAIAAYNENPFVTISFKVPDLPLGEYQLKYKLDSSDQISETEEEDNYGTSSRRITINCYNPNPPTIIIRPMTQLQCSLLPAWEWNPTCCSLYGLRCFSF